MIRHHALKHTRFACALVALALAAPQAFAVNKDMVELQTQIQQLQDAVSRLQQTNAESMGVLKDLVQQSADSVNRMSLTIDSLQKQMHSQADATGGKVDQVSSQVQALNDSLDELKARLNSLERALQAVQGQQQSIDAALQNLATSPGSAPGGAVPGGTQPGAVPGGDQPGAQGAPMANGGAPATPPQVSPAPPAPKPPAPPITELYSSALSDYMAAKYSLASNEFNQVIRNYPDNALSGNAYYYLGEIDYRANRFNSAVKDYDHVLEQFPDNQKVPVSHLHKAQALLTLSAASTGERKAEQREAGIDELRALITRFPSSPEAAQARIRLNGMGVPLVAKRPA